MAFFHGRDAKIVFANPYFCDNLGYTFNEIKGRPFSDFLHPEDAEDARLTARNHDEGITVVSGHVNRWVRKDGSTVNIRWNVGVVGGWFLAEADFLKNE